MKLSHRLNACFLAIAVIGLAVGGVGYNGLRDALAAEKEILAHAGAVREGVDLARKAQVDLKTQVQEWKDLLLRGQEAAAFEKHLAGFSSKEAEFQQDLGALKPIMMGIGLPTTEVENALRVHLDLGVQYREALKSYSSTNPHSAAVVDRLVRGIDRPPTAAIDAIVSAINERAASTGAAIEIRALAQARRAQLLSVAGMVAGLLVSVTLGTWLSRRLSGEIAGIADQLTDGADQVVAASGQISAASQTLAEGASEQAASLEQTGASLEELTSMVKTNAESANEARSLAGEARTASEAGSTQMAEMTEAMTDLKTSSDGVAKIVKVIDEIAFQTNILALNAAVEAARAGEAGMGFAVVADEVRNLAQRSAHSAKETATRIQEAISQSERGLRLSRQVAESFARIAGQTRSVDGLVSDLAAAAAEQAQGIQQVGAAVNQIDKVTQTNASSAEESASAAQQLNSQAQTLRRLVAALQRLVGDKPPGQLPLR